MLPELMRFARTRDPRSMDEPSVRARVAAAACEMQDDECMFDDEALERLGL